MGMGKVWRHADDNVGWIHDIVLVGVWKKTQASFSLSLSLYLGVATLVDWILVCLP